MTAVGSRIPVNDLSRRLAQVAEPLAQAARRVIDSGYYVLGPQCREFERAFADYCGTRDCVGVANGTDALELALRALGCGPGDDVLTVANAGMYSTTAILACGARPVFVDIDPRTLTMAAESLARLATPRCKAVVVTHLYGLMADLDALSAVCGRLGLPIVEDCAQSHGAVRGGRRAGSVGAVGCFSFYPTKNLGALGDGGAVVTNDPALAEHVRALRQYGWTARYKAELAGGRNSRLDEMQAAFLRELLPQLDGLNARRRAIAARYGEAGVAIATGSSDDYVAHLCVLRSGQRDELRTALDAAGIASDIHYPVPDYRQPAVTAVIGEGTPLPQTEAAAASVLSIPCFPELTDAEVNHIHRTLLSVARMAAHAV